MSENKSNSESPSNSESEITPDPSQTFQPSNELTVPDPVKDSPSFTLNDLDAALNDDGPTPDAPAAEHARAIRNWHGILIFVGKKKTALAWRIGRALAYAREQLPNGQWYSFLARELPDISKPTVWRYVQLYERSRAKPPQKALTDAYVDLGIVNNGRNTVEDYLHQLQVLATKIWQATRTARGLIAQRVALLNSIDDRDLVDVDGKCIVEHESGLNYAITQLVQVLDANPDDNIFTRHFNAIGGPARLAVMNYIGKGLRSPYAEYHGQLIPDDCIPTALLDPEQVARWADEHRAAVAKQKYIETKARADYALARLSGKVLPIDGADW